MIHILVIEDDTKLNNLFCKTFNHNGYHAIGTGDGEQAMAVLDREHVDLIVSDIMMPNMDGYAFVKSLREANYSQPVLMITAKGSYEDKERGFTLGVDDYMVKPVDINEMLLRVNALLRRAKIANDREIVCGGTVLSSESLTITFGGNENLLPLKEFGLLYKLLSYPNKIFTRQQLMDEIWGMESETDERTVDIHINRLREKLKGCEDIQIITVRGLGYKAVKKT